MNKRSPELINYLEKLDKIAEVYGVVISKRDRWNLFMEAIICLWELIVSTTISKVEFMRIIIDDNVRLHTHHTVESMFEATKHVLDEYMRDEEKYRKEKNGIFDK